jgi:hypothetical protein
MPDKTPRRLAAFSRLPVRSVLHASTRAHAVAGLFTRSCPSSVGFIASPRHRSLRGFPSSPAPLFLHATACRLRRTSTHSPSRVLHLGFRVQYPVAIRGFAISKLYQHFRERDLPCGLQDSLCTLALSLVRDLRRSATGPTLDTGGWLALTRPGLSPGKRRRALLGAK